jgi:hypothetical protein
MSLRLKNLDIRRFLKYDLCRTHASKTFPIPRVLKGRFGKLFEQSHIVFQLLKLPDRTSKNTDAYTTVYWFRFLRHALSAKGTS